MKRPISFSVVITNYNYEQYLSDAIGSVLNQTYPYFELIIVDDGSKTIPTIPNTVKLISQSNRGLPSARNTGIMNAKNEWLLFLDADDTISPLYLERIADTIQENPFADVIYCDMQHFGDRTDRVKMGNEITKEILRDYNPIAYCSAIRKSCLLECGGYNVKMKLGWEDWQIWQELFARGKKFVHIPEVHFFYRRHGSSMIDTSYKPEAAVYSLKMLKETNPSIYE